MRQLSKEDLEVLGLSPVTLADSVDSDDLGAMLAELGFTFIDNGYNAAVVAHPHDPSMVIRITDPLDGWLEYAIHNQGETFAPRVKAIGFLEGKWIAVVERLGHLSEDLHWVAGAISRGLNEYPNNLDDPEYIEACRLFPGLDDFAQTALVGAEDIVAHNIMLRGAQIVINDPYPEMSEGEDAANRLASAWRIQVDALSSPTP